MKKINKSKNSSQKTPIRSFRLSDYDFEYLKKMAAKHKISISQQLRNIIKLNRESEAK